MRGERENMVAATKQTAEITEYIHTYIYTNGRWVSDYSITMRVAATFPLSITYTQDVTISYCGDYFLSSIFSSLTKMTTALCV